ncbi:hypothetical protein [Nocardioides sp. URHA0032]|uniref:hypothetical protein n=1 Tax=Nocardioides sp. URHA0032 TaxID=1380388 RepID=UPI0012DFB7C1|nr:hypothetical protein [Nocardioides sp. URHA0032]
MVVLIIVIAAAVVFGLAVGSRIFAAETTPRAPGALLVLLGAVGAMAWYASTHVFGSID